jgi:hypothetical protein
VEEDRGEGENEDYAEFVDGSHAGGFAQLEGAKIAKPGKTGSQSGQDQKKPGAIGYGAKIYTLTGDQNNEAGENEDNGGANSRGEVGIDSGNADFSENGGQAGEESGEKGPQEPVRIRVCHGLMVLTMPVCAIDLCPVKPPAPLNRYGFGGVF